MGCQRWKNFPAQLLWMRLHTFSKISAIAASLLHISQHTAGLYLYLYKSKPYRPFHRASHVKVNTQHFSKLWYRPFKFSKLKIGVWMINAIFFKKAC